MEAILSYLKRSLVLLFVAFFVTNTFAKPWLGATFKKSNYDNHLALDIVGVHPSSGVFLAGIVAGDMIVGVEGKPLTEVKQIQSVVANGYAGKKIKIDIVRGGKIKTLAVELTERPDDITSLTGSAIGSKIVAFGKNFYKNGEKRKEHPKAILLDFWATWCGPCRKTLGVLANVYNKYQAQGLEIIGISNENLSELNAFYESQHASPYPLYRDATQEMWLRYGIRSVPTLMLLDKDGYIKRVWSGAPSEYMVEELVKEQLK